MPFLVGAHDFGDEQAQDDRELVRFSPYIAVLCAHEDDHQAWLAAGQALARVLLRATVAGISASFLAQPVERRELRPRLRALLDTQDYPQLVLRFGYAAEKPRPTPRRPVRKLRRRKPA
jgi:hypothetical protein